MTFNPHNTKTADGVVITPNLRVFTNEMAVGRVIKDRDANEDGTCKLGEYCSGDHWFDVEYDDEATTPGNRRYVGSGNMMNGDRMATIFEGKRA
jgi:hypothetical protein